MGINSLGHLWPLLQLIAQSLWFCLFFRIPTLDHCDDGIDIMAGLWSKMTHGSLATPLYQSHNWVSMWPNTIFLSSIFHLLLSDFNLGDKWFQECCERLTNMEYEKSGKDQYLSFFLSSGLCVLVYCELCTCKEKVQYFRVSLLLVFLAYMACGILIIPNDPYTCIIKHQKRPISKHCVTIMKSQRWC